MTWRVSTQYIFSDLRRRSRWATTSFAALAIVTAFVSLIVSILDVLPFILMRAAEVSFGEADMIMRPQQALVIDSTAVRQRLMGSSRSDSPRGTENVGVSSVAPRWAAPSRVVDSSTGGSRGQLRGTEVRVVDAVVLAIQSQQENDEGPVGRVWRDGGGRPLREQECHITPEMALRMGVEANRGDRIVVEFDVSTLVGGNASSLASRLVANGTSWVRPVEINGGVSDNANVLLPAGLILGQQTTAGGLDRLILNLTNGTIDSQDAATALVEALDDVLAGWNGIIRMEFIVVGVLQSQGKFPRAIGETVVVDMRYLLSGGAAVANVLQNTPALRVLECATGVVEVLLQDLNSALSGAATTSIEDRYAFIVQLLAEKRLDIYQNPSVRQMRQRIMAWADGVMLTMGLDFDAEIYLPIAEYIIPMEQISLIQRQGFLVATFGLISIGSVLLTFIFSQQASARSFELAILRVMGLQRQRLYGVFALQSLIYIPGLLMGQLIAAVSWWAVISRIMSDASDVPDSAVAYSSTSVVVGYLLGLFVVVACHAMPVNRVLKAKLINILNPTRFNGLDSIVSVRKLAKLGLSPLELTGSLVCLFAGFVTYYMFPLALITSNFELLVSILTATVIALIVGVVLVFICAQPYLELLLAKAITLTPDSRLELVIRKNLGAHRSRNMVTGLMLSLGVTFSVVGSTQSSFNILQLQDTVSLLIGADIRMTVFTGGEKLQRPLLEEVLERERAAGLVDSWAFSTFPMDETDDVSVTKLTNVLGFPSLATQVYGVDETLFQVLDDFALQVPWTAMGAASGDGHKTTTPRGHPDPGHSLYHSLHGREDEALEQEQPFVLSSPNVLIVRDPDPNRQANAQGLFETLEQSTPLVGSAATVRYLSGRDADLSLRVTARATQRRKTFVTKTKATIAKMGAYFMSNYRLLSIVGINPVLVSMDSYRRIIQVAVNGTSTSGGDAADAEEGRFDLPLMDLWVRMTDEASNEQANFIAAQLQARQLMSQFLRHEYVSDLTRSSKIIGKLFTVTVALTLMLCLISLTLSVRANVEESTVEHATIRSLGLSATALTRSVLWETYILLTAGIIVGTVTALIISTVLCFSGTIFTELPIRLPVDLRFYCFLCFAIYLSGTLITLLPLRLALTKSISSRLKGL